DHFKLKSALRKTIYDQDISKSLILFRDSQRKKLVLPRNTITDIFFMISQKDPIYAYQIIQYYNSHWDHHNPNIQNNNGNDDNNDDNSSNNNKSKSKVHDAALDSATKKRLSLYKRMVSCISLLDPYHHNTKQMNKMVHSLLNEIDEMDVQSKQMLYPNLVVSLVTQRSNTIGQCANQIYEYMIEHDFEMKSGWLNRIISTSKYNRQNDLPFHDVIKRLVSAGGQLMPDSILPAIQNMFPYTNTEQMCITLEAWLEDFRIKDNKHQQRRKDVDGEDNDNIVIWWNQEDLIDLSTLESISTGATKKGDSKLILLVWDVLEFSHYTPTETIYENTIITFANDKNDGLRSAFAAMSSMKEDGFVPSRPLIRSFSSALRFNKYVVGKARRILTDDRQQEMLSLENNKLFSLESFNVIMSSYAERGDPHDVAGILDVMIENDIKPNADSYSFVIEALGRDIKKRLKKDDNSYKQRNVEIADTILSMMEEDNIAPTTHVIRHYIELLCLAGEIETATSIVEDFLSSSKDGNTRVNNITIYRVAIENAILGNYKVAKKLCSMTSEIIPALHRKIASREQRSSYVKHIEEEAKAKDRKASSYRDRGD
ncbi:MAG: pentatricopeptide repeat protein, partial [Bacillariaceae sp.]